MTSALEISKKAISLWRSRYGNENLYGQCQRFSGFYEQWAWSGKDTGIHTYWNATAAADASRMYETRNINSPNVKPGDQVFWWWNPDGHVATVLGRQNGRTVVSHTGTKSHDVIARLGNGVVVSHADTITLPFRGLSRTNGANRQRTGMTAWPSTKKPTNSGDDDLTPTQANQLKQIYAAIFQGGGSMLDGGKSISRSLAEINSPITRNNAAKPTAVSSKKVKIPVRQDNADTNTMVRQLLAEVKSLRADVDKLKG